jgi:signal transduction histidine kinase
VKFSPPDSVVVVEASRQGDRCRLTVRDHGPGLTVAEAASATDRFWRSEDSGETPGTGLGLAIATDLLETIGGELTVASADGGGLIVSLVLPDGADG